MKKFLSCLIVLTLSVGISGCSDDPEVSVGDYQYGVLVINEGNFGHGDGSVSYYNKETGNVTQAIFSRANAKPLGDVIQSATVFGQIGFLVANNSSKVEVVNSKTFVSIYTMNDLSLPRYVAMANGKVFITEWVSFSDPGEVVVIDPLNGVITNTITTDFGAEAIIFANGKLYVSNSFSNTVTVIDPIEEEIITTISVTSGPGEFVLDHDGMIWVICGGDYNENNGSLVKIDPSSDEAIQTINAGMNLFPLRLVTNSDRDQLFYFKGTSAYKVSTSASEASSTPFIDRPTATDFYGIGVDPETDIIYIGDNMGFTSNGTVYRYESNGTFKDSFQAGIGPNSFIFKN